MSLGNGLLGKFRRGRFQTGKRASRQAERFVHLRLDPLEDRLLLSVNVLVNDPTADGTANVQSETALVLGSGSNVVAAFNDSGAGSGHFTGHAHSIDGGGSFGDDGSLPFSSFGDSGDPVLARDTLSSRIYLSTLGNTQSNTIPVFRSFDNGVSFAAPVNGASGFSTSHSLDKEWITVDNSAAAGAGRGNVYLVFTDLVPDGQGHFTEIGIDFTRSTDGGATWSTPLQLSSTGQGAYVTTGPDHALYVFYEDGGTTPSPQFIRMVKSTDQGGTFGSIVTVASLTTTGQTGDLGLTVSSTNPAAFRTTAFPQAVVTSTGIFVTFDDKGAGSDKANVYFTESTNGGTSWSNRIKVNDDTTTLDQWQPAIAATPDGSQLGIFWYDRRLDPADGSITRMGVTGSIVGAGVVSFRANFTVSNTSFPALPGGVNVNPTYMGDYDQVVADNTFFYTTWGDNRTTSQGPNVFFSKVDYSPPTAVNNAYAVNRNYMSPVSHVLTVPASDGLLANAIDPGGDAMGVMQVTNPQSGSLVLQPDGSFTYTPDANFQGGPITFTYTVNDKDGSSNTATATIQVVDPANEHLLIVASGDETGLMTQLNGEVKVYDTQGALLFLKFDFIPFLDNGRPYHGGVRVAVGNVNSDDTVPDLIVARGPDPTHTIQSDVKVYDGLKASGLDPFTSRFSNQQGDFSPYADTLFTGGVFVATGKVNGRYSFIITGPDATGGPDVRGYDDSIAGAAPAKALEIIAYNPGFTGGVRVASADVNGDGKADIITAPGAGGGPNIRVFSGVNSAKMQDFFAYEMTFTGGVYVAAGDTNGDGKADIITGAGATGGPRVRVFSGADGSGLQDFFAYANGGPTFTGGVRVAYIGDLNSDGKGDLLTGPGPGLDPAIQGGTTSPQIEAFDGLDITKHLETFYALNPNFLGGVFVGGN